jgi:hypothetical protein
MCGNETRSARSVVPLYDVDRDLSIVRNDLASNESGGPVSVRVSRFRAHLAHPYAGLARSHGFRRDTHADAGEQLEQVHSSSISISGSSIEVGQFSGSGGSKK